MSGHVTIGMPVYRGLEFVRDSIRSILDQTHDDWDVVFSIDGPDPECEELCRGYLSDSRFRLQVQQQRLGWLANIGWLQQQAAGEFWCYLPQDDFVRPEYLETMVDHARRWPSAAVVYCDLETFGDRLSTMSCPSVVGDPVVRQLSILLGQFAGVAFRGLTRVSALRDTGGGIVENGADDFGADAVWMAVMATWGELVRVPLPPLYRKRLHGMSAHHVWKTWDRDRRMEAWVAHCHDMFEVATSVTAKAMERRLMWLATVIRLIDSRATAYLPWADLSVAERTDLTNALVTRTRRLKRVDLPSLLDASWPEIQQQTVQFVTSAGKGWSPSTASY
jgi:glycosyltransferase involved in cell wall biosynthesis